MEGVGPALLKQPTRFLGGAKARVIVEPLSTLFRNQTRRFFPRGNIASHSGVALKGTQRYAQAYHDGDRHAPQGLPAVGQPDFCAQQLESLWSQL